MSITSSRESKGPKLQNYNWKSLSTHQTLTWEICQEMERQAEPPSSIILALQRETDSGSTRYNPQAHFLQMFAAVRALSVSLSLSPAVCSSVYNGGWKRGVITVIALSGGRGGGGWAHRALLPEPESLRDWFSTMTHLHKGSIRETLLKWKWRQ